MESICLFLKKFWGITCDANATFPTLNLLIALLLSSLLLGFAVSNIIMIGFSLSVLCFTLTHKIKPRFNAITYVFFIFYIFMLLSWFWSIDKNQTEIALQRNIHYFLIPFIFAFLPEFKAASKEFIFRFFSISMLIYAAFFLMMGIIFYIQTGSVSKLSHHGLVSPLGLNRVMVSVFIATAFLYWILKKEKSVLKYFAIILLSFFLILLSSKTIIISTLLLTFVILSIQFKKSSISKYTWVILLPIIPLVIYFSTLINRKFVSEMIPRYHEIIYKDNFGYDYYFNGAELRILYTRFLIEFNKEEPIFFKGFGLAASQSKIKEKTAQCNIWPEYGNRFNFHNQFNQNMAELGIFGVVLLIVILGYGFIHAFRNKEWFFLSFLFIFTAFLITDTPLSQQRGIYVFLIVYFVFLKSEKKISLDI